MNGQKEESRLEGVEDNYYLSHRCPTQGTSSSSSLAMTTSVTATTTTFRSAIAALNDQLAKESRLYGRDQEQNDISTDYHRFFRKDASSAASASQFWTEFILIKGSTGTGKSAIVEKYLAPMVWNDGGFCVTWKFGQLMQLQKPQSFIVEAFTLYAETVQERGQVEAVQTAVNKSFAATEGLSLLVHMIPALAAITGWPQQTRGGEEVENGSEEAVLGRFSSTETTSRFKFALRLFLQAIASVGDPLVQVFEDLHWADEAAVDLLHSLLTDTENYNILFVATYRDDADTVQVQSMLKQLRNTKVTISHIHLANLDRVSTTNMVTDILQTDVHLATSLADLVFDRTNGNAYFIVMFLRILTERGYLRYDAEAKPPWSGDTKKMSDSFQDTLIHVIKNQISSLPSGVLQALKLASCLGTTVDMSILEHLMEEPSSVVASYLDYATERGLLARNWQRQ